MIVVTGAAGFIGSNLVRGLNRIGRDDLLLVDDVPEAAARTRRGLEGLRCAAWLDPEALLEAAPRLRIEAILHQGACTSTTEPDVRKMMKANLEYSTRLLARADQVGARLIYASSAAVYGHGERGFREEPGCEGPLNPYARSKLLFDELVRARHASSALAPSRVVGLRYFNVYGPGEDHKGDMASLPLQLWRQIERTGRAEIFEGSEGFRRDFVFVDDVVAANMHFLAHPDIEGIFNCGSGAARSFADLARCVVRLHGRGELVWIRFPAHLEGRYQVHTCADLEQLRGAGFGRRPVALEEGLSRYCADLAA